MTGCRYYDRRKRISPIPIADQKYLFLATTTDEKFFSWPPETGENMFPWLLQQTALVVWTTYRRVLIICFERPPLLSAPRRPLKPRFERQFYVILLGKGRFQECGTALNTSRLSCVFVWCGIGPLSALRDARESSSLHANSRRPGLRSQH